jgi:hypothetical protein
MLVYECSRRTPPIYTSNCFVFSLFDFLFFFIKRNKWFTNRKIEFETVALFFCLFVHCVFVIIDAIRWRVYRKERNKEKHTKSRQLGLEVSQQNTKTFRFLFLFRSLFFFPPSLVYLLWRLVIDRFLFFFLSCLFISNNKIKSKKNFPSTNRMDVMRTRGEILDTAQLSWCCSLYV